MRFGMNPVSEIDEPFLRLQYRSGAVFHEGDLSCFRGLQKHVAPERDSPFFAWRWDSNALAIENDRYGFYPLFYYAGKSEFMISPSMLKLVRKGAPSDVDWSALAVFLRLGNYVGVDTPFRHIRLVPPNARVQHEGGCFRISGARPRILPDRSLTREAAIDGYIQVFREAIAEMQADGEAIVPLSGGRDSRHIFLELCRQKVSPLSALSVKYEPCLETEDVVAARELAMAASTPHATVHVPTSTVVLERRKNRLTHMATLEHRWILPALEQTAKRHATVYEGVAGDTLSTAWGLSPLRLRLLQQGDLPGLAQSYLGVEGYLPHALTREALLHCTQEAAQQRVVEELRSHLDTANPLGSFHFWNRTRRGTALAPCCIWNQASSVWCPYLNGRVFDFLSSIPASLLIHSEYHRFHTDVILRAYPKFARVPFARKDAKMRPARLFNWRGARQLAGYEFRRPAGTLLRGSFLAPRIVRALIDPSYVTSVSSLLPISVYLRQLEYCLAGRFEYI
jgi:asparagine synthase (glutamine-hydrolysing)